MRVSTVFGQPLPEGPTATPDRSSPFRILVMGDFGGEKPWGKPRTIDRDNVEQVFEKLNVSIDIPEIAMLPAMRIRLKEPDDFHPDRLFQQLEVFASLRTRRQRLENNDTFAAEAEAIQQADAIPREGPEAMGAATERVEQETPVDPSDLLSQALEQTQASQLPIDEQIARGHVNVDQLVRQIVAPYALDKADPRQAEYIAAVDSAISEVMRRVLHHPAFQQVEAAWQGVRMLIRRLETDATLQIAILNVPKQQLSEDVCSGDDLTSTELHRLLVDESSVAGAEPWTIVVGSYAFDDSVSDTACLGRIAQIHAASGSVFISGGDPSIVGATDLAATPRPDEWSKPLSDAVERWQTLREHPASAHVVLGLPCVLGRRPYGEESDPIEEFRFEEIPDGAIHADYLWVNASFPIAAILGQAFSEAGWSLASAWEPEFDGLPIYVYEDADGESVVQPCGEVELILAAAPILSQAGLTAVYSVRGQGSVRIPSLRSLSSQHESVAGMWQ